MSAPAAAAPLSPPPGALCARSRPVHRARRRHRDRAPRCAPRAAPPPPATCTGPGAPAHKGGRGRRDGGGGVPGPPPPVPAPARRIAPGRAGARPRFVCAGRHVGAPGAPLRAPDLPSPGDTARGERRVGRAWGTLGAGPGTGMRRSFTIVWNRWWAGGGRGALSPVPAEPGPQLRGNWWPRCSRFPQPRGELWVPGLREGCAGCHGAGMRWAGAGNGGHPGVLHLHPSPSGTLCWGPGGSRLQCSFATGTNPTAAPLLPPPSAQLPPGTPCPCPLGARMGVLWAPQKLGLVRAMRAEPLPGCVLLSCWVSTGVGLSIASPASPTLQVPTALLAARWVSAVHVGGQEAAVSPGYIWLPSIRCKGSLPAKAAESSRIGSREGERWEQATPLPALNPTAPLLFQSPMLPVSSGPPPLMVPGANGSSIPTAGPGAPPQCGMGSGAGGPIVAGGTVPKCRHWAG